MAVVAAMIQTGFRFVSIAKVVAAHRKEHLNFNQRPHLGLLELVRVDPTG